MIRRITNNIHPVMKAVPFINPKVVISVKSIFHASKATPSFDNKTTKGTKSLTFFNYRVLSSFILFIIK